MQQQDGNVRGRREGAWNSSDCVLIRPYLGICTTLADVSDVPVLLLRQSNHTEMTVSSKLISSSSLSNVEVWNHSIHRGRQPPNSLTPTLEYTTVEFSLVRISWTRSLCSERVTAYVNDTNLLTFAWKKHAILLHWSWDASYQLRTRLTASKTAFTLCNALNILPR